jgi:hypothetical protein
LIVDALLGVQVAAAFKRKNGQYLVLVEDDWRGKNLLYRWLPKATANVMEK